MELLKISRHAGIADQYAMTAYVRYEHEEASTATFVGSVHGGPIVLVMPSGYQTFVSSAVTDRIGTKLDEAWIRRFFEEERKES